MAIAGQAAKFPHVVLLPIMDISVKFFMNSFETNAKAICSEGAVNICKLQALTS